MSCRQGRRREIKARNHGEDIEVATPTKEDRDKTFECLMRHKKDHLFVMAESLSGGEVGGPDTKWNKTKLTNYILDNNGKGGLIA